MSSRSRHSVLVLVLIVAMIATMLGGCAEEAETDEGQAPGGGEAELSGEPYKIGAVLSLTGTYAGLGEPEQDTIVMEVERINEAGGVHGRPIEVIIEDDATDAQQAVAATTRLIDQEEVVAIIGATGTGSTMAMRSEIDRARIPQVSIAGGTVITADFHPWVFQTPWSNTLVVPFALRYLEDQGVERVGLISDSGGFGADGREVVLDFVDDHALEIVADETFNAGDTDMTAQLTKIKGADAEAVLMWTAGSEAATIAKNMRELQMDVPLVGSHGNARKEFIEGAGDAAEGFVFPAGKVLLPEAYGEGTEGYLVATDFIERYESAFGVEPNTFAGHAYDGLYLIVEAMERLDEGFTAEELRDGIEATDGFVGIGGTFTYSADDHNGMTSDDLVIYEVENGEWTLAE